MFSGTCLLYDPYMFAQLPIMLAMEIQADLLTIPDASWREIFNSDAAIYGGDNVGNWGAAIPSAGGRLTVNLPARGLLVFVRL